MDGYAIGTGFLQESVLENDILSVPLKEKEMMTIGYIVRTDIQLSDIAQTYIAELEKFGSKE